LDNPSSYGESTDFATVGRKKYPAKTRLKSLKVVVSDSESSKAPKPNYREPTAAKSSLLGTFLPNLATLVVGQNIHEW